MRKPKYFIGVLALVVLLASAARSQAQYPPGGWQPPPANNIQGVWYLDGDPSRPCYVDVAPNGRILFTNERGDRSWGRNLGVVGAQPGRRPDRRGCLATPGTVPGRCD
jgi:hypothetical protein